TTQLHKFRSVGRGFMRPPLPAEHLAGPHGLLGAPRAPMAWWQGKLNEKGWGGLGWPVEYGGPGWSTEELRIFMDESVAHGAPMISPFGIVMVGPVIYTFGNEAQKKEHLPPIIRGERFWCQGYSEPGSGSDLASLKTRAVRDGDDYIVNGQKIWTTHAHFADWMFCLVRTDPDAKKQRGISFLLIDMKSPGIEVRPIRSIDGLHHLNEVFFTDVRVPVANLVGEENQGWTYAKFLLVNERAGVANVAGSRLDLSRLKAYASSEENFVKPPISDPVISKSLTELEERLDALDALEERSMAAPSQSMDAVKLGAPLKLLGSELSQEISELAVRVAGPGALPMSEDGSTISSYGAFGQHEMSNFLFGRSHSIYGGTSEVQKNIMAQLLAKSAA
ncbi:MAG: acyl-CoA dehydrogenase family protein, partial [Pseudomonadota bacterium]